MCMNMKNNVIRNICTFLFVTISVLSFAQNEESQELQRTIQVYSEYKPQISDASRISVNPKVYDTLNLQVNLKYDVETSPLKTDYHIIPLKAVSVKGDKLQELYRGEAVVGLGNYWNNLVSVRYMTERSRLKQTGIEFYHFGSAGKVKLENDEKVPAGYTTDYVSAYWKRFYDDFTLTASIKPQYKSVLRYGYNTDYELVVDNDKEYKKDIRRSIFGVNANVGIKSTSTDEDAIRYDATLDYDLTCAANPTNIENLVGIQGGLEKDLERISLGFDGDIQLSALNFEPKDVDSSLSKVQSVIRLLPYAKVGANAWNLRVGVKLSPVLGGISTFKIFPDVAFTYSLPKLKMIPYFKIAGNVDFYSMKDLLDENPYACDSVMIRPSIDRLGFELGLDGRLLKLITYNASFSVKAYEDMYFWKAYRPLDGKNISGFEQLVKIDEANTLYSLVYDDATLMKLHGDLGFLFRKVNFGLDANYYLWQVSDSLKYAWYKPIADVTISSRFSLVNPNSNKTKLTVEPQLYYMLYQSESEGDGDLFKKSIVDLGIEVNYFYNSVFELFVDVNNILGLNNQRYIDYPTQRCNFLIGASYSFGGHKE